MNILKSNFVVGLTAGVVATVLAPVLIPALRSGARPLAKSLVRGGFLLYEKGREAIANAGEVMEDVVAEVRAETLAGQAGVQPADEDDVTHRMYPDLPAQTYGGNGAGKATAAQYERGGPT